MPFTSENQPKERKPRGKSKPKTIDDLYKYVKKRFDNNDAQFLQIERELDIIQEEMLLHDASEHIMSVLKNFSENFRVHCENYPNSDKSFFEIQEQIKEARQEISSVQSYIYDRRRHNLKTWIESKESEFGNIKNLRLRRSKAYIDSNLKFLHERNENG